MKKLGQLWHPHEYQRFALQHLFRHPHSALFLEPGLGKSSIVLATILSDKLYRGQKHRPTLIVAPLRVIYHVWSQEIDKWDQFKDSITCINLHALDRLQRQRAKADILLINPEGLTAYLALFRENELPFGNLVIDESTTFKSPHSKRFKAIKKVLPYMRRRHILTGTPSPQSRADLWAQSFILDRGERFGRSYHQFIKEWFYDIGTQYPKYAFKQERACEFDKILGQISLSMRSEDYLDLPPRLESTLHIDLPPEARKQYDKMEEELFMELDSERITAANVGVATIKLQQIANGFVYQGNEREGTQIFQAIHDAKLEAIKGLVDELQGNPAIIAVKFSADVERLREVFPDIPYVGGKGGVSQSETNDLINRWNRREVPLIAIHPRSMGHGVNMQGGGDHIIWYSPTWSVESYLQLNARVHRQGRERPVIIHHILAKNTVEEVMLKRMGQRRDDLDEVMTALDALHSYRLNRQEKQNG